MFGITEFLPQVRISCNLNYFNNCYNSGDTDLLYTLLSLLPGINSAWMDFSYATLARGNGSNCR